MRRRTSISDIMPGLLALAGGALLLSGIIRQRRRMSFRGASVVITGGSRGLGLEMARLFAREGARLTLLARDQGELERARRELISLGGYVLVHACDIRNADEVDRVVDLIVTERGRIDVLINNAGVMQVGPFENMTGEDFRESLDVHVWGPLSLIRAVTPVMQMQGCGRIVNISSIGGVVAVPHLIPYSTGKFALTGLSDGVRAELAKDGILVTTVLPGLMRTGSHVNAQYKGQHKKEFRWFATLLGIPLFSINAERAARRVVEACRYGEAAVTLGMSARLLKAMNAQLPGLTAVLARLAARILPSPDAVKGSAGRTGWDSASAVPSFLTRTADQAIARNNEAGTRNGAGEERKKADTYEQIRMKTG